MNQVKHLQNSVFLPQVAQLVSEGHTVTLTARGQSMMPFIRHNRDQLVLAKPDDWREGDVVLAEVKPGLFVCHRVVVLGLRDVLLQGDGNVRGYEHCKVDDVRAKLVGVVRGKTTYRLQRSILWRIYSALWPETPFLRRVLLALYRVTHGMPLLARNVKLD